MKIVALGDRETILLCRLGGVAETHLIGDAFEDELKKLLLDDTIGIILIQDTYARSLLKLLDEHGRSHRVYPVVIGIPGPDGPVKGDDSITEAIRRVAGRGMPG
jgi:vacuolar-type H+-ATPase subunit F/Vma7